MVELKAMRFFEAVPTNKEGFYQPGAFVDGYLKKDVDAAIAELKEFAENACIERDDNQTAIDELQAENAELKAENERLKAVMPEYDKFIKDEKFKKKLVDEYDGYVYEWMGHRYIATPYINVFIKGIFRALWLARAERANESHFMWCQLIYDKKYGIVKFNARKEWGQNIKQGQTLHTPQGWADVWDDVERKCRAKAEEYK